MNSESDNLQSELAKIKALHQQDMKASKEGDYKTLHSLLTKNAVMMPPNSNWIKGQEQLEQNYQQMEETMKGIEILKYQLDFEEVKVLGDYAFEWGKIIGSSRNKDGEITESIYKVMRILKKNDNGEWKVHRSIWNSNPSRVSCSITAFQRALGPEATISNTGPFSLSNCGIIP